MRKFLSLFSLMLTMIIGTAQAEYGIGERLTVSTIQEGDLVVFEAACTVVNYGYYINGASDTFAWSEGLSDNSVWRVISSGGAGHYDSGHQFFFQNVSSGKYMGGTSSSPTMVTDIADATPISLNTVNNPWTWVDFDNQTNYPRGWDNNSVNMRGATRTSESASDWWYANDPGNKATGAFPNSGGLHNWAWNVYKVGIVGTDDVVAFSDINNGGAVPGVTVNGLKYNLVTNCATGYAKLAKAQGLDIPKLYIPATITYSGRSYRVIGFEANDNFYNGNFSELEFESPTNLLSIGDWCFASCNNVKEVVVPDGVRWIRSNRAFGKMNSLEKITFPASVKYIQDYTFSSDPALTTIIFKGTTAPSFSGSNMFAETTVKGNITIVVPDDASILTYQNALASYDASSFKEFITEETYLANLYGAEFTAAKTKLQNAISSGIGYVGGMKDNASLTAAEALLAGSPTLAELQYALDNYVINFVDGYYRFVYPYYYGGADANNYLRFGNDLTLYADLAEGNLSDYSTVFKANIISTETRTAGDGYRMTLTSQGLCPTDAGYDTHQTMADAASQFAIAIRHNEALAEYLIGISNAAGSYVDTRYIYKKPQGENWKIYSTGGNARSARCYIAPATDITVAMHSGEGSYWATLCVPFGVTLPAGTEAYVGTLAEKALTLTSIGQDVPAGTPVVLKGDAPNITATINGAIADFTGTNDIKGQYLAHEAPSTTHFSLGILGGKVGFYPYTGTIGANKAYVIGSSSSNGFNFVLDDDVTGIQLQSSEAAESQSYYDLQGRKVVAPQKGGLYIKGGKIVKM